MQTKNKTSLLMTLVLGTAFCAMGHAQSIQMSSETFQELTVLPIAPAKAAQDKIPLASSAALAAAAPATFLLEKGKRVDEQLAVFGGRSGWTMVWQAPDYVLDHSMPLQGDFETSLIAFLRGANEAGIRLRATFFRGNKTVRVTEF